MDIRFRFISVSDINSEKTISGFALCYDTLEESNIMFETLMRAYEETKVFEKTIVKFSSHSDGSYKLLLTINGNETFCATIDHIEKQYVCCLKEAIEEQGTIFVISAKSTEEEELSINKGNFICVTRIYIDDIAIERESNTIGNQFDIDLLKRLVS